MLIMFQPLRLWTSHCPSSENHYQFKHDYSLSSYPSFLPGQSSVGPSYADALMLMPFPQVSTSGPACARAHACVCTEKPFSPLTLGDFIHSLIL